MKAVVVHQYGGPEVLKFEEYPRVYGRGGSRWQTRDRDQPEVAAQQRR
jgi:hypothetical protein